jgi:hypothetical protein
MCIAGNMRTAIFNQMAVTLHGSVTILLDDGSGPVEVVLNDPTQGLLIGSMVWRELYNFSDDCVLMVLADQLYDPADYITDYAAFLSEGKGRPVRGGHDRMRRRLVLIGAGEFAQIACEYFEHDSPYEVVAFSVEREYLSQPSLRTVPWLHTKPWKKRIRRRITTSSWPYRPASSIVFARGFIAT